MISKLLAPKILAVIFLALVSIIALKSLLSNSFYTSHDGFTHTARIAAYYKSLKDGQFPPRWGTDLNGKLGSPIFTYIYPLPYFLGSLSHVSGMSYQDSFRIITSIGYFLSGLTCFLWLKNRFGNLPGLLGAIFYLWVPYRFLNIYVRAAYAENLSYLFIPLIFLAIDEIFKSHRWGFFLLVFSTCGMLLSHNLVAAIFLPLSICWSGWQLISRRNLSPFLQCLLAIGIGFLMSSFIYFPDLFERQFVKFDTNIVYFREHFVTVWQLLRGPWGYGFDFPGEVNDAMSFQLGLAQILASVIFLLLFIKQTILRKASNIKYYWSDSLFQIIVLIGSIIIMIDNPVIRQLWENLPGLKTIVDFPWRFLGVTNITFAFIAAALLSQLKRKKIFFCVLVVAVLLANRNFLRVNKAENFSDLTFDTYTGTSTATSNEFTPFWRQSSKFDDIINSRVDILSGPISVTNISGDSMGVNFITHGDSVGKVRINRFYFPETQIKEDGIKLAINNDYKISTQTDPKIDNSGTIELNIKSGEHKYALNLIDTPVRKAGNIVSLITFFLTVLALFIYTVKNTNIKKFHKHIV